MTSLANFLRSTRPQDIRRHLADLGMDVGDSLHHASDADVMKLFEDIGPVQEDRLFADIERICAMVDEIGQTALESLPGWIGQVCDIEGAHARTHWTFLHSPEAFRRAEEIRYADENQNAQRLWDAFVGPKGEEVRRGSEQLSALSESLKAILGKDRIHIDMFERSRQRESQPDQHMVQLSIYSEDVPEDVLVFAYGQLANQTRRPVRETAIVYEVGTGTIEVVGRQRNIRADVAAMFAEVMLGAKLSGERLVQKRVDLLPLLEDHSFPTQPGDGIARVKMTRLALSSSDNSLTQIFQVPFKDKPTLYEVVQQQYGDDNPLDWDLHPWSARIEVEFEADPDAKRGKKIAFTLTAPNKCSLRGKTKRERQLLAGHLQTWGLAEDP